jgi:repressor of nif and glnA expression
MDFAGPNFVVALIALSTIGWIVTSWIRAKHGYPVEGEWGGLVGREDLTANRQIELLSNENASLTSKITRLEDRLAVLERIATDVPTRLAADIDALR